MTVAVADVIAVFTPLSVVVGGLVAIFQWRDQRKRELEEKRFEQYWKLVDVSQETTFIAKQRVALLLLKRYPEYADETANFLMGAKAQNGGWVTQNLIQIDEVLRYFGRLESNK
jgi:hypothetical protein